MYEAFQGATVTDNAPNMKTGINLLVILVCIVWIEAQKMIPEDEHTCESSVSGGFMKIVFNFKTEEEIYASNLSCLEHQTYQSKQQTEKDCGQTQPDGDKCCETTRSTTFNTGSCPSGWNVLSFEENGVIFYQSKYEVHCDKCSKCWHGSWFWRWRFACEVKQMEVKVLCTSLGVPVPLPWCIQQGEICVEDVPMDAYCICQYPWYFPDNDCW